MATATETGTPAILMGRCVICKQAVRVEIPAEVAERFGPRLPNAIGYALQAAAITPPRCGEGHAPAPVRFAVVKAERKPEIACGGKCWAAKSSNCACSCEGKNHGGMHAQAMRGI
jgi:hypothetical protein